MKFLPLRGILVITSPISTTQLSLSLGGTNVHKKDTLPLSPAPGPTFPHHRLRLRHLLPLQRSRKNHLSLLLRSRQLRNLSPLQRRRFHYLQLPLLQRKRLLLKRPPLLRLQRHRYKKRTMLLLQRHWNRRKVPPL